MAVTPSAPELFLHILPDDLQAFNSHQAIRLLAADVANQAGLADASPLVESAMLREGCEPTYLGKGMALPHARVAGLPAVGVCVAHSVAGIPWNGGIARLMVFLAVPEESPELYLQLMSRLVRWRLKLDDAALNAPTLPAEQWEKELRGWIEVES